MTFTNDDGDVLEADGDLFLTKRATNVLRGTMVGDVSVNFTVDNNSENRKKLGYYGPNMASQVAFFRQPWTITRNGNPFVRGSIVVQRDEGKTLSCFFLSGNSSWFNLLQGLINELDWTGITNGVDYRTVLNATNVRASFTATSGIIFPLVDWCYDGNKGNMDWFADDVTDSRLDDNLVYCEFYPCLYLHTLMSEIFKQNDLKLAGNILTDRLYQSMIVTPISGELRRPNVNQTTGSGVAAMSTGGAPVSSTAVLTVGANPDETLTTSSYTAVRSSRIRVKGLIIAASASASPRTISLQVHINGVSQGAVFTLVYTGTPANNIPFEMDIVVPQGGVVTFVGTLSAGGSASISFNFTLDIPTIVTANDYVSPEQFLPKLKCLDIVKFVCGFFPCVAYFDEYSKTVTINALEKMNAEDAQDFSDYYLSHTVDYTQNAKNNFFRLSDSNDTKIRAYNQGHELKYGEANITAETDIKINNDVFKSPFGASEFIITKSGEWLTNIRLVNLIDDEPVPFTAIFDDSGTACFRVADNSWAQSGMVIRVVTANGDNGHYIVVAVGNDGTSDFIAFYGLDFEEDNTGLLYPQKREFINTSPRILVVNPTSVSNISTVHTELDVRGSGSGTESATAHAHFSKPVTTLGLDSNKMNLAIDNPDIGGFSDPPVRELYYGKLSRMLRNPVINVDMMLPEAVFQEYDFSSLIRINTKDFTGVLFPLSFPQYKNGGTRITIPCCML